MKDVPESKQPAELVEFSTRLQQWYDQFSAVTSVSLLLCSDSVEAAESLVPPLMFVSNGDEYILTGNYTVVQSEQNVPIQLKGAEGYQTVVCETVCDLESSQKYNRCEVSVIQCSTPEQSTDKNLGRLCGSVLRIRVDRVP